jgi:Kelch motif protein
MSASRYLFIILPLMFLALAFSTVGASEDIEEYGIVSRVGDMIVSRYNHTATLFDDDMVLVTGGTQDGVSSLASCEIFVGEEGWASAQDMDQPRMRHSAGIIPGTERIMVTGGWNGNGHPSLVRHFNGTGNISLSSSEIFDPTTSSWSNGPELNTGRFWHESAVTANGELIVIGGLNVSQGALASCEVYRDGNWVEFSPLPMSLARFAVVTLDDGTLLVIGGHDGKMKTGSSRVFKLVDDEWTEISSMNKGRGYFSGALLPDGRVIVIGGFSVHGQPDHMDGEIYDPETDEWTLISNMAFPRHNHATVVTGDDIVVIGGSNCDTGGCHSGIEVYDIENDEWKDAFHVVLGRKWAQATVLYNGSVLINGGKACDFSAERTELFFPQQRSDENKEMDDLLYVGIVSGVTILLLISLNILGMFFTFLRNELAHFSTLILGGLVMFLAHPLLLLIHILIVFFTMIWFWKNICTHCYAWNSKACPSGHGLISGKFYNRSKKPNFRKAFKRNIWTVALQWFVPLSFGVGSLILDWDWFLLIALCIFSVVGFIILPVLATNKGCKECPQRKDCPYARA